MITVKQLKDFLEFCPEDWQVRIGRGEQVVHMETVYPGDVVILSDEIPEKVCARCGNNVFQSGLPGYLWYCPSCDEDLYDIETNAKNATPEEVRGE